MPPRALFPLPAPAVSQRQRTRLLGGDVVDPLHELEEQFAIGFFLQLNERLNTGADGSNRLGSDKSGYRCYGIIRIAHRLEQGIETLLEESQDIIDDFWACRSPDTVPALFREHRQPAAELASVRGWQ